MTLLHILPTAFFKKVGRYSRLNDSPNIRTSSWDLGVGISLVVRNLRQRRALVPTTRTSNLIRRGWDLQA